MWRVKYGEQYLHDPVGDEHALTDIRMGMEANAAGWCEFTIPEGHPLKSMLKDRDRSNPVEVWLDDEMLWAGFVYERSSDFLLSGRVSCKGELAYLDDVLVRPYSTVPGKQPLTAPSSVDGYFSWLIDRYNERVDSSRRFVVGVNNGAELDGNNHILRESSQLPTVSREIQDKLIERLGGYLFVRRSGGVRYIDYLAECSDVNAQVIDFGENLLDFARTDTTNGLFTAVRPEGKDGLTIESMPDGTYPKDAAFCKEGDVLVHREAAERYGVIEMQYSNPDAGTVEGLCDSAAVALRPHVEPKTTIEAKLVDMAMMAVGSFKPLRVGELVRVRSRPHGFDGYMLVAKIEPDLLDPSRSVYTLGTTFDSLTGETNRQIRRLNASINSAYDAMAPIGQAAKDAAEKAEAVDKIAKDAAGLAQSALDALADLHGAYVHIRFSASPDGVPMTEAPQADTAYMGICSNGSPDGPADPDAYSWARTLGSSGEDGVPGAPGADGAPSYLHVKWSESPTGDPMSETPGPYMGTCVDSTEADPIDPALYTWTRIKGDKGDRGERGLQGLQGEDGAQGMPGKPGADGKPGVSSYTHIAYSNSADGTVDFSLNESDRAYIGMYVDSVQEDSSTPSKYAWSKIKGADGANGTPGKPGEDGKTPYLHIAYANSADGTSGFSTTDSTGKLYIGQYTDHAQADSSTPSMYAWTKIKGEQGPQGKPGANGQDGADGKTLYGTCSTAAATAAKAVSDVAGFSLYPGAAVAVTFSHSNTASLPTLDVNGSGAKRIMINGANAAFWVPGSTVPFVYDGTAWQACNAPIYGSTATIGSPSGGNVYVDGDSVSVRQGTTVLARLKAGLLELAANSANAVIKLCGGKGAIAYYAGTDQLAVMAPGSIALAACQTLSDGTVQPYDSGVACNRSGVLLKGAVEASGSFSINGQGMADHVVAQGTSGIWRWRKWASGDADCRMRTVQTFATTTPWGSLYYDVGKPGGWAFPFAFKETPNVSVDLLSGFVFPFANDDATAAKACTFWAISAGSYDSLNVTIEVKAEGRWK
jgi:hypothetical protein